MSQSQSQTPADIQISRSELEEKLKEINKVYREINTSVKKVLNNLYKLQEILIREGPKINININDHCAVLEELAIGTIHVAYDFFHTFIGTKIRLYDKEGVNEKFDFKKNCCGCSRKKKRETKRNDVGVVNDTSNDLHFSGGEK